jgi:membrane associated rhomboid family serine protease
MFPLGDDNPTQRRPIVNYAIIGVNLVVFLVTLLAPDDESLIRWTMVPSRLRWETLLTNFFLHANLIHLLGNMWMLWIFGDNVEDRLGHLGYAVFYLACGFAADAAHILTNLGSPVPTLGASGAIAGVMGAYVLFYPQQRIRTLIFLFIFVTVARIPAFVWIGIWFVENLYLSSRGLLGLRGESSGVAYTAHVGGFLMGLIIAAFVRFVVDRWPSSQPRWQPLEPRDPARRVFTPIPDDSGIEYLDEPDDGYSVLRLSDDPPDIARIGQVVAGLTPEPAADVAARLEATRGMIVRTVPRDVADRIQRELHVLGIPSAKVLHNRSNLPPRAVTVEGASWDDRALRLRAGDQILPVPWSSPFLWAAARIDGRPFVDIFVTRRSAYRILGARHVPLTEVDPTSRREISSDLASFARAVLERAGGATSDGLRAAAGLSDWGRLDFGNAADYDDYLFWLYTLTLAKGPPA